MLKSSTYTVITDTELTVDYEQLLCSADYVHGIISVLNCEW